MQCLLKSSFPKQEDEQNEIPHLFVILSLAKNLGNILHVIEILPSYGRQNDKMIIV